MKKPSKEKVSGFFRKLLRISVIIAAIVLVAFIFSKVTTNKYIVSMNNTSEYSQSSDFESTYVVKNVRKYGKNNIYTGKELNVKADLLNDNMKKVSKVKKFKDKVYAEQSNSIHLDIPDNLEDGRYNVRVKVRRFLVHDTFIIPINISSAGDIDVTTSFDKGIYNLDDSGKETSLTGPRTLTILFDSNVENAFDAIIVTIVKKKNSTFMADVEKLYQKNAFNNLEVSDVYFSKFNNTILLDVGKDDYKLLLYVSNCIDVLFD